MSAIVHVVAVLETKPGTRDAVLAAFADNLPAVLAEKGCLKYVPTVDTETSAAPYGPDTIVVIEEWETQGDLDAHAVAPHMAKFSQRIGDHIIGRRIHVMTQA
ncbi:putative quinol monooxygenase [Oceaniglobus trochenteri]|uniref:putative quinol monooxygenase n=1 Tax=Oceaniglobus trochenteri TaxID=2763260 RepID=UPI001CFFDADF|nr:putative quinol monooxygenase [Oceaniglobus trochenteri]